MAGGCAGGSARQDLENQHERLRKLGESGSVTASAEAGNESVVRTGSGASQGGGGVMGESGGSVRSVGSGGVGVQEMTSTSIYSPSHGERLYVEAVEEAGAKTGAKTVLEQRRVWKSKEGEIGVFSLEISQPRRMGKTAGEWKPARTLTFGYGEAGEVGLRTLVDHEKMTSTRFEPPLVMLPATMKVGQTHQANTKLEVLDLERNSRVIDRGEAAVISTLTLDKDESGGVQPETLLLQTSMTFEIGPARVLQERGQRIQPQTGSLVSEIERLRVKVGMITIKRDDKSWKLVP